MAEATEIEKLKAEIDRLRARLDDAEAALSGSYDTTYEQRAAIYWEKYRD